jgi:ATP adenylyltransferase/5',5'''-P-1,P-4-tetraphosphate phosphorylase II
MLDTILHFNSHLSRQKPESIKNRSTACPFCDRDSLEEVLAERGAILLVKNKYNVLQDTFQTVLIESDDCDANLTTYSKEHLYKLFEFGVEQWLEMERSGEFASVMFFKNHGPFSGGSIHHPHMQIIGLYKMDYMMHTKPEHFQGLVIERKRGIECNLSTYPRAGFYEFNIVLEEMDQLHKMADYIQMLTDYLLHHFHFHCNSFNLFFYRMEGRIMVKVVPRFVTSPLFVGYSIPQVSNNLEEMIAAIKQRYF